MSVSHEHVWVYEYEPCMTKKKNMNNSNFNWINKQVNEWWKKHTIFMTHHINWMSNSSTFRIFERKKTISKFHIEFTLGYWKVTWKNVMSKYWLLWTNLSFVPESTQNELFLLIKKQNKWHKIHWVSLQKRTAGWLAGWTQFFLFHSSLLCCRTFSNGRQSQLFSPTLVTQSSDKQQKFKIF